jgi:hypothetical protein
MDVQMEETRAAIVKLQREADELNATIERTKVLSVL